MTQHDNMVRLRHMFDHASEAAALVRNKSRNDLDADRVLSLALVRLLEIVGEAAGRVSHDLQAQHPQIAWRQIISLRNRLIHGYEAVDSYRHLSMHSSTHSIVRQLKIPGFGKRRRCTST